MFRDQGWTPQRARLLDSYLDFEEISRRHRVAKSDFRIPLDAAVEAALREHPS